VAVWAWRARRRAMRLEQRVFVVTITSPEGSVPAARIAAVLRALVADPAHRRFVQYTEERFLRDGGDDWYEDPRSMPPD
jgi:hypothetical protein